MLFCWITAATLYVASAALCYTYWMRTALPEPNEEALPPLYAPETWRRAA